MVIIIIINGQILKPFLLRMGIRMSPLITSIQDMLPILASAIRQEKVEGIEIGK